MWKINEHTHIYKKTLCNTSLNYGFNVIGKKKCSVVIFNIFFKKLEKK